MNKYILLISIEAVIVLSILAVFIALMVLLKNITTILNKKINLENRKMLFDIEITEDITNLLDIIIQESVAKYRITYLELRTDLYINEKIQNDMIRWVIKDTLNRISPVYYEKLCYVYNKDVIQDIIYEKASLAVLNYTISVNGTYDDKK